MPNGKYKVKKGKYNVKWTMDKVQNSARSARMMNDEGRLALVETICAQRSELFIRTSSFVNRTFLQIPIFIALYPRNMQLFSIAKPIFEAF